MGAIFGWLLDTLNYRIEKSLRESIYKNDVYKKNRWSLLERQIIKWSARPFTYLVLLFIATLLWMRCIHDWLAEIRLFFPGWVQPWSDLIRWQDKVFGGQLTIIGLIFPLVVGFVGILLSNKSANRALWGLYNSYSGFMFTGLSGLSLSAWIITSQFFHPWLTPVGDTIFSICISLWLVFNLLLLAWFLFATFKFINIDSRSNLVLRYCINEALIVELKSRLSNILPHSVLDEIKNDVNDNSSEPSVRTYLFSRDEARPYQVKFKADKYLRNISFRILHASIWFWKIRTMRKKVEEKKPRLIFPVSGGARAEKEWDLAFYKDSTLSSFEKFLICLSYRFSKNPSIQFSSFEPIIQALAGNIDDALAENKIRLFLLAVSEIEEWHIEILSAASFREDNEVTNWLLLEDGSFGGASLHSELLKEYYEIGRNVVQKLPQSSRYFESLCYLYLRVYLRSKEKLAPKIVQELMRGHYFMWSLLVGWHGGNGDEDPTSVVNRQFDSALKTYIGTWERWTARHSEEFSDWANTKEHSRYYLDHLVQTARFIIIALRHKQGDASEWAADMLVHWYGNSFSGRDVHRYPWRQWLIVHTVLGEDPNSTIWTQILNGDELDEGDAFKLSLNNAWFDVRIVTGAYILNKAIGRSPENKKLAMALIKEKRLRPTGGIDRARYTMSSGADVLQAYIRQRWSWLAGDRKYSDWIDSVVESFGMIEKEAYVTGRIYSGWGRADIHELQDAYIAIAISFSVKQWVLPQSRLEMLCSDFITHQERKNLIRHLQEWAEPNDEALAKAEAIMGDDYSPEILENYKQSIGKLIKQLVDQNIQEIADAPVDNELLEGIGRDASAVAFPANMTPFPISLFSNFAFTDQYDEEDKCTQFITGYERSYFAKNVVVDRAGDEARWIGDIFANDISISLLSRLFNRSQFIKNSFTNIYKLIDRFVEDAKSIVNNGYTPVLLISPWEVQELLNDTFFGGADTESVVPYVVRRDDGYPEEYVCHLDGFEVYQTPFRKERICILANKEMFKSVSIRNIEDGQYLDMSFVQDEKDATKGKLTLSYWMKVMFSEQTAFKYELLKNKE